MALPAIKGRFSWSAMWAVSNSCWRITLGISSWLILSCSSQKRTLAAIGVESGVVIRLLSLELLAVSSRNHIGRDEASQAAVAMGLIPIEARSSRRLLERDAHPRDRQGRTPLNPYHWEPYRVLPWTKT